MNPDWSVAESISCQDVREGLTEYLELALSSSRRRGYEDHFRDCLACRENLARTEALIRRMSDLSRESMPRDLKSALHDALHQSVPPSRPGFQAALAGRGSAESE